MKKQFSISFLLILLSNFLAAQNGEWTWMHGSSGNNVLGNFGTQGVAAPTNNPPGLYETANWTDNNGNFWILGGWSANTTETALWKFDPLTNMWTWVKGPGVYQQPGVYGTMGVPSPTNYPGSRCCGSATWTDNQNNLWVFGGYGYDINGTVGPLNDLWMYNITTNEWTWMKGSSSAFDPGSYGTYQVPSISNDPPGRFECTATWVDNQNGDLWFIGGCTDSTYDSYGDMWRYSISTNEWTWMKGASTLNAPPYYGTKGIPSSLNSPGGRCYYSHWKDNDGNFWTYGGYSFDTIFSGAANVGYADMWRFNPVTLEWTWMAGSNVPNDTSTFTEKCVSSHEYPEASGENKSGWTDECGRFWSICGSEDLNNTFLCQNDLWVFDPGTNHFTWVSGPGLHNQNATYGTILVPSPTNYPGAMDGACSFKDQQGNFWLFGGDLYINGLKNTLWKYVHDTDCVKYTTRTLIYHNDNVCSNTPVNFTIDLNGAYSYQWDFGDPSSSSNSSTQAAPSHSYSSPGVYYATLYFTPQITTCRSAEIATTQITILDDVSSILFPNVFTPNADNTNDVFPDIRNALDNYHLQVFNRWGQLVFETTDTNMNWDGKLNGKQCPAGVYYWIATVSDCSGNPKERNGYVELIL